MESKDNYIWHYNHFLGLAEEFQYRYNKDHATVIKLKEVLSTPPRNIPNVGLTPFAQAMSQYPDCIVEGNAPEAYRNYYHMAKPFAKWEKARPAPGWWKGYQGAIV
jgi:hypothetical protein